MVGCTIVRDGEMVGEGFHQRFGGPHAEIEALASAGARAQGATVYVTLEPCCHQGKTGPCTQALVRARVGRVVVAERDPFPQVAGRGIGELEAAGIKVEVGLLESAACELNAPYHKLIATGRPWIIAKWAMTLDGHLATHTADSRWTSGTASREVVHRLRGRVDAIIVGHGTVLMDDPLLTARPPGPRTAARILLDSQAALAVDSQLARTARDVPVIVAASEQAPASNRQRLTAAGCEVLVCPGPSHCERLGWLLDELGRRRKTNVLVEGGAKLLGSLLDAGQIDEVHAFIAPKMIGGQQAPAAIAGRGFEHMADAVQLATVRIEQCGADVYVHGRIART
jgi:diaminohydroxyphosphoribosylaminopyrimidine deaminase/5-amino-6-(5-phosphoribosylamino)uracil reductase